ncbi:MAG: GrpB family protein, partial [Candidatus Bathyarchaeota archaeon]
IWPHISDVALDVVHVGSTSIPGMDSKPIIDIDIVIDSFDTFDEVKFRLTRIGYYHRGNLGIEGREMFGQENEPKPAHHLYVCSDDSTAYKNHILLKKHLMENREAFRRYRDLKLQLAASGLDIDSYTRKKTLLIIEFLKEEGLSTKELNEIKTQNLA